MEDIDILDLIKMDNDDFEQIQKGETMDYKSVLKFLEKNPAADLDDLKNKFPNLEESELLYFDQQFKVKSGKIKIEDIKGKSNTGRNTGIGFSKGESKKLSVSEKVFFFLRENPNATNEQMYDEFQGENQNTIRAAKTKYDKRIMPMVKFLEENPEATVEELTESGVVDQPPMKHFRIAQELAEMEIDSDIEIEEIEEGQEIEDIDSGTVGDQEAIEKENKKTKQQKQSDVGDLVNLDIVDLLQKIDGKLDKIFKILNNGGNDPLKMMSVLLNNPDDTGDQALNLDMILKFQAIKLLNSILKD